MNTGGFHAEKQPRVLYLDLLRIGATFAIIMIHAAGQSWYDADIHSSVWKMLNVWESAARWAIPIFVMISGALFLDARKKIDIKRLYTKNIFRIFTAFVFWSLIYAIYTMLESHPGKMGIAENLICGHYHMWFLFMIAALYMLVPVLRKITENESLMKYFLIISFVFNIVLYTLFYMILPLVPESKFRTVALFLMSDYNDTKLYFVGGYPFYFILGYYLSHLDAKKRTRILLYVLAFISFLATIAATTLATLSENKAFGGFYDSFTINIMFMSVGVFLFAKNLKCRVGQSCRKLIVKLSTYSFGIYLVHALILEILDNTFGISTRLFHTAVSVPGISVFVFIISAAISAVLHQIPVLKKYIV